MVDVLLIALIGVAMVMGAVLGYFAVIIWNKFKQIQIKRQAINKIKKQDYKFTYDGVRITDFEDIKNNNVNKDSNSNKNVLLGEITKQEEVHIPSPVEYKTQIHKARPKPQSKFLKREK